MFLDQSFFSAAHQASETIDAWRTHGADVLENVFEHTAAPNVFFMGVVVLGLFFLFAAEMGYVALGFTFLFIARDCIGEIVRLYSEDKPHTLMITVLLCVLSCMVCARAFWKAFIKR